MHLQQNLQRGQAGLGSSEDGEDSEAERGVAPVERPGRLHGLGDGAGGMLTALDISSGLAKGAWHFSQFNVWWAYLCYPADAVHVDEDGRHTLVDVTLNAGVAGLQPHEGERLQLLVFPKSRFKDSWDFAMALCTLYTMVIVPYRLCFFTPPGPFAEAFDRAIDMLFIADVVLSFRTCVPDPESGIMITSAPRIARLYTKGWFVLDLLSAIPFDFLVGVIMMAAADAGAANGTSSMDPETFRVTKMLRMLRIAKLLRITRAPAVLNAMEALGISRDHRAGLKFLAVVVLCAHVLACVFHLTGGWGLDHRCPQMPSSALAFRVKQQEWARCCLATYTGGQQLSSWLHITEIACQNDGTKYLTSMYWTINTMTTTGYGDTIAVTNDEKLVSVAAMAFGAVMFSLGMSVVTDAFFQNEHTDYRSRRLDNLKEFAEKMKLPKALEKRCRAYLKAKIDRPHHRRAKIVLQELTPSQRTSVQLQLYRMTLQRVHMFTAASREVHGSEDVFLDRLLCNTAGVILVELFSPQDVLWEEQKRCRNMMIVVHGVVLVEFASGGERRMTQGDLCGEQVVFGLSLSKLAAGAASTGGPGESEDGGTAARQRPHAAKTEQAIATEIRERVKVLDTASVRHVYTGRACAVNYVESMRIDTRAFIVCAALCEVPLELFEKHHLQDGRAEAPRKPGGVTVNPIVCAEDRDVDVPSPRERAPRRALQLHAIDDNSETDDGGGGAGGKSAFAQFDELQAKLRTPSEATEGQQRRTTASSSQRLGVDTPLVRALPLTRTQQAVANARQVNSATRAGVLQLRRQLAARDSYLRTGLHKRRCQRTREASTAPSTPRTATSIALNVTEDFD